MNKPQYDIDEALVQRYREGKLSEEEQTWLEANPFEAEALAGLAGAPQWQQDVSALQQKLQEHTAKRVSFWTTYGRYAAAIALLFAVGWVAYQFAVKDGFTEQPARAVQLEAPSLLKESVEAESTPDKVDSEGAALLADNQSTAQPDKVIKPVMIPEQESIALLSPASSPALAESPSSTSDSMIETSDEEADFAIAEPPLTQNARSMKRQAGIQTLPEQFGSRIVGSVFSTDDQSPLPGVNVIVKGTQNGTITDIDGRFSIPIPDSSESRLVFSFIGFQPEEVAADQGDSLSVVLTPDETQLSEVVVTRGSRRRSGMSKSAHPLPSYQTFREYLKENLQYPEEARQQSVEGTVKVQFTVEANGDLTDFTIKKSLGYGCDEEAIRLIKSGPEWRAAYQKGELQDQEVTVKVRFTL